MGTQHPASSPPRNEPRGSPFDITANNSHLAQASLPDPSVCEQCHALYHHDHWQWNPAPDDAHRTLCPACVRIRDKLPMGYVSIEGRFAREYRNELHLLIQHTAKQASIEDPMQRVISIDEQSDGMQVTTTYVQLARQIGEVLRSTYKGDLDFHYNESEGSLRIRWQRWK
jgi:hypothetical protein